MYSDYSVHIFFQWFSDFKTNWLYVLCLNVLIHLYIWRLSFPYTLGPVYNEHPAITSRFLCIKIIDCNVKKFNYNEHPLTTSRFFCIFLLVVSGIQCIFLFFRDTRLYISFTNHRQIPRFKRIDTLCVENRVAFFSLLQSSNHNKSLSTLFFCFVWFFVICDNIFLKGLSTLSESVSKNDKNIWRFISSNVNADNDVTFAPLSLSVNNPDGPFTSAIY